MAEGINNTANVLRRSQDKSTENGHNSGKHCTEGREFSQVTRTEHKGYKAFVTVFLFTNKVFLVICSKNII